MSQQNTISIEIPVDMLKTIEETLFKLLSDLAPYLISLSADQKKGMLIMGDSTQAFVNKTLVYTQTNPEFVPAFLNVKDLQTDVNALAQLSSVAKLASQLNDNIEDTLTLCGSEAFIGSLMYYNSVKQAAKNSIPASKTIYQDLQSRFPGRPREADPAEG